MHLISPLTITSESHIKVMKLRKGSSTKYALDRSTNSLCQYLRKCIENMHTSVGVLGCKCVKQRLQLSPWVLMPTALSHLIQKSHWWRQAQKLIIENYQKCPSPPSLTFVRHPHTTFNKQIKRIITIVFQGVDGGGRAEFKMWYIKRLTLCSV